MLTFKDPSCSPELWWDMQKQTVFQTVPPNVLM